MRGRVAEVAGVLAMAFVVTAAMAAPVLLAPSERVFGMEIVGRHHDAFTVMARFGRPIAASAFSQPVTDVAGALLARLAGPVAAYNWLVLLSFPLSAAAAYLLARHLALSPTGAAIAALAYAFSPFHMAHAAYHPHVAQTQWVPLYLLALMRCLDNASPYAVGFLGMATVGVTLSNFYGGFIAAVMTPIAVSAYWLARARTAPNAARHLMVTIGALAILSLTGLSYVWWSAPNVLENATAFSFPPGDAFRYSAKWWGYLVPPVAHPLLGGLARKTWIASGVHEGLLEQQVSLGWAIVALGAVATYRWLAHDRRVPAFASVPILATVAAAALICSLSPERTIGGFTFVRPSALLRDLVPMFRAYARFGVVVQLMAALLAGAGFDFLRASPARRAQLVAIALVAVAIGEYAVSPAAAWHEALPTKAHRWVARQADRARVLDCAPLDQESASVQWLTGNRVTLLGGAIADCTEPGLTDKLAAHGFSHLLVRRDSATGRWFAEHPLPRGLGVAARFDDGLVLAVTSELPAIYTAATTGFSPREHDPEWAWQWMGIDASWTIVNTSAQPVVAVLNLEISAFHRARRLDVRLDGSQLQTLVVEPPRSLYRIGPLTVIPGVHKLAFHPAEAPTTAGKAIGNGDGRPLSFAFGAWSWDTSGTQP